MSAAPRLRSLSGRSVQGRIVGLLLAGVLALVVTSVALAQRSVAQCPFSTGELSTIVGKTLQRVNLADPKADPMGQCSFSVVLKGTRFGTPQVYLTVDAGNASDLRSQYTYYLQMRSKLATKPRVVLRSDVGPGAFMLSSTTTSVSNLFFLLNRNTVATLAVDLGDRPLGKQGQAIADKIFALVAKSR